jgi:hypothetical protein
MDLVLHCSCGLQMDSQILEGFHYLYNAPVPYVMMFKDLPFFSETPLNCFAIVDHRIMCFAH